MYTNLKCILIKSNILIKIHISQKSYINVKKKVNPINGWTLPKRCYPIHKKTKQTRKPI